MGVFFEAIKNLPELSEACELTGKGPVNFIGASEGAKAHILAAFLEKTGKRAVVISPNEAAAREFSRELSVFTGREAAYLPAADISFKNALCASYDLTESRIRAIDMVNKKASLCLSASALLCFVMPKKQYNDKTMFIKIGAELKGFTENLASIGYTRVPEVSFPGQFAVRGGITDVYPPQLDAPIRIEFFGDEADSIRCFDLGTQLSTENIREASIFPADSDTGKGAITDYFGDDTAIVFDEPYRVSESAKAFAENIGERIAELALSGSPCDAYPILDYKSIVSKIKKYPLIGFSALSMASPDYTPVKNINLTVKILSSYSGKTDVMCEDVSYWLKKNYRVMIMSGDAKHSEGISEALTEADIRCTHIDDERLPEICVAGIYDIPLRKSFEYPTQKIVFVSGSDIFSQKQKRKLTPKDAGKVLRSFDELAVGDYVVHRSHGIGRFEELVTMNVAGVSRDYLRISYRDSDTLYVPVNQLNLLYKYSHAGADVPKPKINRLGGTEWQTTKSRVKANTLQLAIKLIELYAERSTAEGHAFSSDTLWQSQFESEFIYEETHDQLRSVEEIKSDMEKPKPMDRLLCGDVGYGKTEVAIRAAFKCIMDGYQCAYLVPTTILASQHFNHFIERMRNFPVRIEMLSRFRTKKQQDTIIKQLKRGEIDVIIGTHRLLGDDVKFKRLGLLVIDEEQRFGVGHKEKIKNFRRGIDVLTLTATPIPRTLNMAMSGIRDMSIIANPPEERRPIQTYVLEYDSFVIYDAIEKEMSRGGQVYYVFNRVAGIYTVAAQLKEALPEANIAVAHGQMNERELEDIMMRVLDGEIDVLVCTTIIETGIDIPNVNTLIVENADCMGLSQLYQLRGRVGRSSRVAYAYLTFKRDKALSEVAEKRLLAIKEFTELGAGFKVAMRDLEIRGAGNILGPEQHGFMASVGYDMYLRLLSETVEELQGKTAPKKTEAVLDIPVDAGIPDSYIENSRHRLEAYRTIADIETEEDKMRVTDELIDRFGDIPPVTKTLLEVSLLRTYAANAGVKEISGTKSRLVFLFDENNPPKPRGISNVYENYKKRITFKAGKSPRLFLSAHDCDTEETVGIIKNLLKDLQVSAN